MRFAIRDDDICFHTDPALLQQLYSDLSRVCPVSFSCIPFVGGFDVDRYTEQDWQQLDEQWRLWQTKEVFPIGENKPLIDLLHAWCAENRASIMLHGIHHRLYEWTQKKSFMAEVKRAKIYLESLFQRRVTVATPPNNSLKPNAVTALASQGFNILTAFGHLPSERPASVGNYLNFLKLLLSYLVYGRKVRANKPLNFSTHQEQPCYTLGPRSTYDELLYGLRHSIRKNGHFVLATHYYHLEQQPHLLEVIYKLIDYANEHAKHDLTFVTAEQLFEK